MRCDVFAAPFHRSWSCADGERLRVAREGLVGGFGVLCGWDADFAKLFVSGERKLSV
jgi:hypothetical protein